MRLGEERADIDRPWTKSWCHQEGECCSAFFLGPSANVFIHFIHSPPSLPFFIFVLFFFLSSPIYWTSTLYQASCQSLVSRKRADSCSLTIWWWRWLDQKFTELLFSFLWQALCYALKGVLGEHRKWGNKKQKTKTKTRKPLWRR